MMLFIARLCFCSIIRKNQLAEPLYCNMQNFESGTCFWLAGFSFLSIIRTSELNKPVFKCSNFKILDQMCWFTKVMVKKKTIIKNTRFEIVLRVIVWTTLLKSNFKIFA